MSPARRRERFRRWREAHRPWLQAVAVIGALGTLASGFYLFDDQYQRKAEARLHERDDAIRSLWSQLGVTQLRAQFLEDRVYDLAARKASLGRSFPVADDVSLARYKAQLDQQAARAAELRRQIDEANKR